MTNPENRMPETEPEPLVKAQFLGGGRDGTEYSNVLETPDEQRVLYNKVGAVTPPLDPVSMANLFEMSGSLRSNIDAYSVNIDSFGHRFVPIIDLENDDAFEQIKLAMIQERILGLDEASQKKKAEKVLRLVNQHIEKGATGYPIPDAVPDLATIPDPTDAEVKHRMEVIRREQIRERIAVEKFFSFCTVDQSFEQLRMKMRQDLEIGGNAYWEVLRNKFGEIVQFDYVPGYSVRLMPSELYAQTVHMPTRATLITPSEEMVHKRYRKYVQVANGAIRGSQLVWFKEFGDPRIYSCLTGTEYKTLAELKKKEPGSRQATELIHFKIHSSRSIYGVPRWISEMLAVIGSRHADEVNLSYFENRSVPPMAILVSGGRIVKDDVTRLENFIKNEIKGKRNFHKVMILQAESGENGTPGLATGKTKIELKPLTDAQSHDAQFLKYKETNMDAIGMVFRLPRLLRGDARDFNRATAQTSLEFTEQQVFAPLRKDFDYFINQSILPMLGINFWRFQSKGPDFTDPSAMLEQIYHAAKAGYLTPEELRTLAARAFGIDFARLDQDWVTRPLQLTLGGITTGQTAPSEASDSKDKPNPLAGEERSEMPTQTGDGTLEKHISPEEHAEYLRTVQKLFARKMDTEADDGEPSV